MLKQFRPGAAALGLVTLVLAANGAQATSVKITVENTTQSGGFSFTPLYFAFQNGNFDAFSKGQAASAGLEQLAELGSPALIAGERLAVAPLSQGGTLAAPGNGVGPVDPGERSTTVVDVDGAENRYLTFLSMILPSNDTFFGSADPFAYELFDSAGTFRGKRVIYVTGDELYDAGTEVNDPGDGPAFILGANTPGGTVEGGTVQKATSLSAFAGQTTPLGTVNGGLIDFTSDPQNFSVAKITVREVTAPVPLPAAAVVMLSGLGLLGGMRVKRGRRTAKA